MRPEENSPTKILVIDDNPFDQIFITKLLGSNEINIHLADSAFEAEEMLGSVFYSLIICDINMPVMNGFEFIAHLKNDNKTKHIPVVLFSNQDVNDALLTKGFSAGAFDILSKSSNFANLRGRLNAMIELTTYRKKILIERNSIVKKVKFSNELLAKTLPLHAINEIKKEGKSSSRLFKNATVMFADFSNFTQLSLTEDMKDVVSKLDSFFCKFDEISERIGIEKIKTIGDSYMSVGGIPIRNKANPYVTLLAALEMKDHVNKIAERDIRANKIPWFIKFGISTGEVVSGLIGSNKVLFDVWGDTVNVASRLESMATKNTILISESTKSIVEDLFEIKSHGKKQIKNWGIQEIFEVKGIKNEFSSGVSGNFPNSCFFDQVYEMRPYADMAS